MTSRLIEPRIISSVSTCAHHEFHALRVLPWKPASTPRIRSARSCRSSTKSTHLLTHFFDAAMKSAAPAERISRLLSTNSSHEPSALTSPCPAKCASARRALSIAMIIASQRRHPLERALFIMCRSARSRGLTLPTSSAHELKALRLPLFIDCAIASILAFFSSFDSTHANQPLKPFESPMLSSLAPALAKSSRVIRNSSHERHPCARARLTRCDSERRAR